jgi:hypothetical protein
MQEVACPVKKKKKKNFIGLMITLHSSSEQSGAKGEGAVGEKPRDDPCPTDVLDQRYD